MTTFRQICFYFGSKIFGIYQTVLPGFAGNPKTRKKGKKKQIKNIQLNNFVDSDFCL
jgi:hypothetical protein